MHSNKCSTFIEFLDNSNLKSSFSVEELIKCRTVSLKLGQPQDKRRDIVITLGIASECESDEFNIWRVTRFIGKIYFSPKTLCHFVMRSHKILWNFGVVLARSQSKVLYIWGSFANGKIMCSRRNAFMFHLHCIVFVTCEECF